VIVITFAYLMPDHPQHGTGFYLDGEYAGYLGQDADGSHFVYFHRPFWQKTLIREARGYVLVAGSTAALFLVRRVAARLAYRRMIRLARSALYFDSQSVWFRRVLSDPTLQREIAHAYIDQRTWNDPAQGNRKSDPAFTPECASHKDDSPVSLVRPVHQGVTFNIITYFDGTTRRVTAADIQAGAEPRPVEPAFPFARAACPVAPVPQATPTPRALFLPTTVPPRLLPGRQPAAPAMYAVPTTMRNTP